jgi:hypothetical protein
MTTFLILLAATIITTVIVYASVKMGVRFNVRKRPKPGTIIEVGWGHGYAPHGRVKIDGEMYVITDVTQHSITIGDRS